MALFCCLVPGRWWSWYGARRVAFDIKRSSTRFDNLTRRMGLLLDPGEPPERPADLARECMGYAYEGKLQALREVLPGRWRPQITLKGAEHVHAGLAAGNGVILWIADFAFSTLVTKIALYRAGFQISHLSSTAHGWSSTEFGARVINPIPIKAESRFLRERVILSDLDLETPYRVLSAMRVLRKRLQENGVISITALASNWGPRIFPFGRGEIRLADGAPSLAYASGAPILPVFVIRRDGRHFDVIVESPLPVDRAVPRAQAVSEALSEYVRLLDDYVSRHPQQWTGCAYLQIPKET